MEDFSKAEIVVLGTFTTATKGSRLSDSSTEFAIEQTIKDHPLLKGKKSLTLPRYLQPSKEKFLIFCDVYKNELDPYRAIPLASETMMVKYLTGAMAIDSHPAGEKLRYYFDFLPSAESEIGMDAYRQFAKADYKDYATMAKSLPADTIAGWLRDPKTPSYRLGLYASLLGHCGTAEHAKLLKKLIDDPETRRGGGVDGIMAGYVSDRSRRTGAPSSRSCSIPSRTLQLRDPRSAPPSSSGTFALTWCRSRSSTRASAT